ncbi:DUF2490 domain-containing protein [Hymenobacter edaphi]|uniref:DUF2490 domain-containing protein n=1 Tax=Hymenobacter edaphi TaxID=2211146 RepID=A0A328BLQ3_9BACT|nr:DUF2490 domain-containing protein [Hymenobacter edaphi]RAK66884.1 DUF2490 domain-containing protein [Hymenobacter edaphi]
MISRFRAAGLLLALVFPLLATAQQLPEGRVADRNDNVWGVYNGRFRLSDKWGLYSEAQLRRTDSGRRPQQSVLRLAADYYAGPQLLLSAGAIYQKVYPYGAFPAADVAPEHGFYEQLQLGDASGRVQLQQRYRLEQRWIRWPEASRYTFQHRARYQLGVLLPLFGPRIAPRMPYLTAADEVMLNFGRHAANVFDQNRLYVGLGYAASRLVRLEAGYLNQLLQQRNGRVFEHNHTLQLSLLLNVDLRPESSAPVALPAVY